MQPFLVLYARGGVNDVVEVLCEASKDLSFSLWSLGGNPCSMRAAQPMIARRMCIVDSEKVSTGHIPEEQMVGSVHVVQVAHAPSRCRVSFHLEDLSGSPLISPNEVLLRTFCSRFDRLLNTKGIKVGNKSNETKTSPINLPPLAHNDTGPLPA